MKILGRNHKALLFLLLPLMLALAAFSAPASTDCTCSEMSVTITSQSSGAVSFSWDSVDGATGYEVWYEREADSYVSQPQTVTGTSISFSNLPTGTYDFYFVTECGTEKSAIIVVDDLMM